jgi:hypothetical protein
MFRYIESIVHVPIYVTESNKIWTVLYMPPYLLFVQQ